MTVRYGLEDRTVLLTGAAGGIGQALARAFAAQGARLLLVDREAAALDALIESLHSHRVHSAVCELGSDAAVADVAAQVGDRFGRLDVLVHNAGTEFPTPVDDASEGATARWAALLDNNVSGMWRLTRALLPLLPRGNSVIHQSSIWGRVGVAGFSAYSASKHAIVGLTRSLALELGPRGIRVNAVCPGWVRTDAAMRSLAAMALERGCSEAEVEREILSRQALPVMLTPDDLAGSFLFLASDGSAALTGQCLCPSHGEVML
jgi:NAD(P)-dependent dehydrogenase (short-subunit alcohol dehydrogenase family)